VSLGVTSHLKHLKVGVSHLKHHLLLSDLKQVLIILMVMVAMNNDLLNIYVHLRWEGNTVVCKTIYAHKNPPPILKEKLRIVEKTQNCYIMSDFS